MCLTRSFIVMNTRRKKYMSSIGQKTGRSKTSKNVHPIANHIDLVPATQNLNSGSFLENGRNSSPMGVSPPTVGGNSGPATAGPGIGPLINFWTQPGAQGSAPASPPDQGTGTEHFTIHSTDSGVAKPKEAETCKFDQLGSVTKFRGWKLEFQKVIAAASGVPEKAYKWIRQVRWTLKSLPA